MTKVEFIPILEAILRQADSNIEIVDFSERDGNESIEVIYRDGPSWVFPVTNLSLMAILAKVSDRCAAQYEVELLGTSGPAVWPIPPGGFKEWASSSKAKAEAKRFLEYRYRLNEAQADYIFGKMALFLLQE